MVLVVQNHKNNYEKIFACHMKLFHKIEKTEESSSNFVQQNEQNQNSVCQKEEALFHKNITGQNVKVKEKRPKKEHENDKWKCTLCGLEFSMAFGGYNKHMRKCHPELIQVI